MRLGSWISSAAMATGALFLLLPALAGNYVQTPPPAKDLPPGAGHDAFVRVCNGCHVTALVTSQRKSADDWASVVIEMRNRGAVGSDQDLEDIVGYLAANFGPAAAPVRVNVNSASAAEIAGALSLPLAQGNAIVEFREKSGKFKDITALEQVPGADTAKMEAAKDRIDF
ncbi:ComEA family DNA-binding protein [Terriglobus roseus]|uniref:Competence protein ComEA helix-hairpin-helix repeat region n=1 Tax=Terriglobus roseus TaxID=392734 RepID=A0A1H4NWR6_9BACT|nr:helix-hairpin-helix domain-containing protein [Terriglobus roseus]SEB99640.1 competence protein ComEA helix-hairpin-helix repeat region [Terriglobus roseus]